MPPFPTLDAIITGLALFYLITICANLNYDKRSTFVRWLLFITNIGLVITTLYNGSMLLFCLWLVCLVINGSSLKKD